METFEAGCDTFNEYQQHSAVGTVLIVVKLSTKMHNRLHVLSVISFWVFIYYSRFAKKKQTTKNKKKQQQNIWMCSQPTVYDWMRNMQ